MTTSHAAPVPTAAVTTPTAVIITTVFPRYRGSVVATKWGHIFSVGVRANQITAKIGKSTNAAMITAPADQGSSFGRRRAGVNI